METLKSLREKAKMLRSKVSSAPLSKATPDQLRSEILMLERAVKAEEKVQMKKAMKEATVVTQKKKITEVPVKVKAVATKSPMEEREKELAKREKELAKKEKLILSYRPQREDTESESDDY